jgi:hypothetical protein
MKVFYGALIEEELPQNTAAEIKLCRYLKNFYERKKKFDAHTFYDGARPSILLFDEVDRKIYYTFKSLYQRFISEEKEQKNEQQH